VRRRTVRFAPTTTAAAAAAADCSPATDHYVDAAVMWFSLNCMHAWLRACGATFIGLPTRYLQAFIERLRRYGAANALHVCLALAFHCTAASRDCRLTGRPMSDDFFSSGCLPKARKNTELDL